MSRYEVKIIGPTTDDRMVTVSTLKTKKAALTHYEEWRSTHGSDHGIILQDNRLPAGKRTIAHDMSGVTIDFTI